VSRRKSLTVELLRDVLARVVRASEALQDGELDFLAGLLHDLADDLWREVERLERGKPPRRRRS
jgi:hypothetical protein